ncbi:aquaporin AQPAn.G-like [Ptychodera flava]|uniref:aquaporin AQPAn.G-like n=1 Tax=Ptychodera flava TaxID=63121 RepID=UPI00396A9068
MSKMWDADVIGKLSFWRAVVAECLAALLYVFVVCASFLHWHSFSLGVEETLLCAFTAGFMYATMVHCFEHVSGGHLNPATTFGMLLSGRIGLFQAFFFIVFQCGGGIGGAAILFAMTPDTVRGYLGVTRISDEVTEIQAFAMEVMITFIVVFTVFATFDTKRQTRESRGLAVGLAVVIGNLIGLSFTGASMNPARTIGPAVIMGIYDGLWVYCAGPLAGGVLAGWLYVFTFGRQLGNPTSKPSQGRPQEHELKTFKTEDASMNHTGADNAAFVEMESQTPDFMNHDSNSTQF